MSTQTNTATPITPLQELRGWLADSLARCRQQRWYGAAFRVDVAQDITSDAIAHQSKIARTAYSAEQADLEAAKIIEEAASDGLSACDMPAVAKALRLIRRSAKHDHDITEAASV